MKHFFLSALFLIVTSYLYPQDQEKQQSAQKSSFYRQLLQGAKQITLNQESFDVTYYSIDLTPDPNTELLSGKAQISLKVVTENLDRVELNFWDGMVIDSLYLTDNPNRQLVYSRNNDLLAIELGITLTENEQSNISIVYKGYPEDSGYGSFGFETYIAKNFIGTFNQPYGARGWWPCKDYPLDKADSLDIRVTVPSDLIVASNGVLRSKTNQDNLTTYWWHHGYPIATYLVSLAIYPYYVWSDTYVAESGQQMPIMFYTFTDTNNANPSYLVPNYKKTRSMIEFFSDIFGEYPFLDEKYGHAEWTLSFGMEHQTLTSMGNPTERRVAHELAHMWWGDMITCRTYNHIWLNEGFARYAESLWFEFIGLAASASEYQIAYHTYKGSGTIYVEDVYQDDIFDIDLAYNKASWVLHMLRGAVGDSTFFEILKAYHMSAEHQHKTATTESFQAICEQVSGLKLNKFFQQWIYGEYFPRYSSGWKYKAVDNGYNVKVEIKQKQNNTGLFWMPVDVNIVSEAESSVYVAWDSMQTQTFEFFTNSRPVGIDLDPGDWILKETAQHLLTPYTENVWLDNPFQNPGTEILNISARVYNPDSLNVGLSAMIESSDQSRKDSIGLFDDGLHRDGLAGDGTFGGSWAVPEDELYYSLHTLTHDLDSGYTIHQADRAHFTTIGPVSLYGYESPADTVQAGANFFVKPILKNNSATHTIPNVTVDFYSNDTCIVDIVQDNPNYGTIPPGETIKSEGTYLLRTNPLCHPHHTVNIEMQINSNGNLFWIDTLRFGIISSLENENEVQPMNFGLDQNYPNPFNSSTVIKYHLPKTSNVDLSVYNLLGQKVASLVSQTQPVGKYSIQWDAKNLTTGIYYYKLDAGNFNRIRKMIYLK